MIWLPDRPRFTNPPRLVSDQLQFDLTGPASLDLVIDVSTDLSQWSRLVTLSNPTGSVRHLEPTAGAIQKFYRARLAP